MKCLDLYGNYVHPLVNDMLPKGYELTLSDIRDSLSRSCPGILFHNHKLKSYVQRVFGECISFCQPYRKNEAEVVFPSSIKPSDMVAKMQLLDTLECTVKLLRSKLREVDFGLHDSFCDKTDLVA